MTAISKDKIAGWLKTIGHTVRVLDTAEHNEWCFEIDSPVGGAYGQLVLVSKQQPERLVIISRCAMPPDLVTVFNRQFNAEQKIAFNYELEDTLLRYDVIYQFDDPARQKALTPCPAAFEIGTFLYEDGLSLDALARATHTVYRANYAAILLIHRLAAHLAPGVAVSGNPRPRH